MTKLGVMTHVGEGHVFRGPTMLPNSREQGLGTSETFVILYLSLYYLMYRTKFGLITHLG